VIVLVGSGPDAERAPAALGPLRVGGARRRGQPRGNDDDTDVGVVIPAVPDSGAPARLSRDVADSLPAPIRRDEPSSVSLNLRGGYPVLFRRALEVGLSSGLAAASVRADVFACRASTHAIPTARRTGNSFRRGLRQPPAALAVEHGPQGTDQRDAAFSRPRQGMHLSELRWRRNSTHAPPPA
jgi:hypothetical protein